MKIKLPVLQVSGVILAFAMAIIAKFVMDVPELLENIVYIIALALVIFGNFRTKAKRRYATVNNQTNLTKEPIE